MGGSILEITGSHFGLSLENSFGTKVTIGVGDPIYKGINEVGVDCTLLSVANNLITCEAPAYTPNPCKNPDFIWHDTAGT
jgi:hypothetical protein